MLKHTHVMTGCAVTLAVFHPDDYPTLLMSLAAGMIGSEIADIDSATSKSHKDADLICTTAFASVLAVLLTDVKMHAGICKQIFSNNSYLQILIGCFLFLGLCMYGKEKPHRTFMHSFVGLAMLTGSVWIAFPEIAKYFFTGYLTHIVLDVFNKKNLQLFYPLKKGFCLNVCKSNGKANAILGYITTIILVLELMSFFAKNPRL